MAVYCPEGLVLVFGDSPVSAKGLAFESSENGVVFSGNDEILVDAFNRCGGRKIDFAMVLGSGSMIKSFAASVELVRLEGQLVGLEVLKISDGEIRQGC